MQVLPFPVHIATVFFLSYFFFFLPFHLYDQDKQVILCNYIYVQKVDSAGADKYTLFSTLDKTVKLGFFCFFGRGGGFGGASGGQPFIPG